MAFQRYVALGDSFTEGVGDPDPARPNGVRGWADRVAEVLTTQTTGFGYANLAVRGRLLHPILSEQIEPAVALRPDLVTVNAGGNDLIRPRVDIDALVDSFDAGLGELQAAGTTVVVFTHGDGGSSGVIGAIRGRVAIFNELLREVVDRRGLVLVDNWRLRGGRDPRNWDTDRLHLNQRGHLGVAINVLDTLGVPHGLELADFTDVPPRPTARQNWDWTREHLAPWVGRRLTGRSSGDGLGPKRPTLRPI